MRSDRATLYYICHSFHSVFRVSFLSVFSGRAQPKFETSVELLDPMAEVQEESKVEEEKPAENSTDENAALLVKLLSNPETAALLKALAKTI